MMIVNGDIIKRGNGTFEVIEVLGETEKTWEVRGISNIGNHSQEDVVRIRKSTKIVKI